MTQTIERLSSRHEGEIAKLFAVIAADQTASRFHPHDFSDASARHITGYGGRDIYLGLWGDEDLVGYGMLRGWDAGYDIPSLGIYLSPPVRGRGLARTLMSALHDRARQAGANHVRLKVYRDNIAAVLLYERLGYIFQGEENGQSVGILDLRQQGV